VGSSRAVAREWSRTWDVLLSTKHEVGRLGWVLVAGLHWSCVRAPALGTLESPSETQSEGIHEPFTDAARAERSAWPGIAALSAPPDAEECTYSSAQPWLTWQGDGEQLAPMRMKARPMTVAPLPFAAPAVLHVAIGAGVRTVVRVDDGWLVAVDRGENSGGLYSVRADTLQARRLDESLIQPVRWIGESQFGILGVAGLCHGDACAQRTSVYEVSPAIEGGWGLRPLALMNGCPAAASLDPAGASLVVAAQCGALYRIEADAAHEVAAWPPHLGPTQVVVTGSAAEVVYHVSFGRVLARFRAGGAEWFAPLECASLATELTGRCRCVSAP
jgi:hypothetical protein